MWRVYVHHEAPPEHTHLAKVSTSKQATISDLKVEFVAAYNATHGKTNLLKPASIEFRSVSGKVLSDDAILSKVLEDRADVFAVERDAASMAAQRNAQRTSTLPSNGKEGSPAADQLGQCNSSEVEAAVEQLDLRGQAKAMEPRAESPGKYKHAEGAYAKSAVDPTRLTAIPLVKDTLMKALEAQQTKNYKHATQIFEGVLEIMPRVKACFRGLGSMALEIHKYKQAVHILEQAVAADQKDAGFHRRLGDAYLGQKDSDAALREYDSALGLVLKQPARLEPTGSPSRGGSKRVETKPEKPLVDLNSPYAGDVLGLEQDLSVDSLKLAIARALYGGDTRSKQAASEVVMSVLRKDESNEEALFEYARIASDQGMLEDAVRVYLRLLVARHSDKAVRKGLAEIVKRKGGLELLRKETKGAARSASAHGILATVVKDHGGLSEASALFQTACSLAPANPHYVLNLIHTLEVCNDCQGALEAALKFLKENRNFDMAGQLDLSMVIVLLEDLPKGEVVTGAGATWLKEYDLEAVRGFESQTSASSSEERNAAAGVVVYSSQQLDLLALLFTVVKILYIGGAIKRAMQLGAVIEPARLASKKELHETLIRNEAAYFCTAHQILTEYPLPLPLPTAQSHPVLYLAGDSHCLSAAWRTAILRGQPRLLAPLLVTGLKAWHLREESDFYPKVAFHNIMQSVAGGSQVIMMFGEIDCREGILVSVDKCRYKDVEEGVTVTVKIYVKVLLQLIRERGFEIFVHPAPSVIDETRPVSLIYNSILKERVLEAADQLKAQGQEAPVRGRLHWLDFFQDTLTPHGKLKEEFKLDGTHMSPSYGALLQRELEAVE